MKQVRFLILTREKHQTNISQWHAFESWKYLHCLKWYANKNGVNEWVFLEFMQILSGVSFRIRTQWKSHRNNSVKHKRIRRNDRAPPVKLKTWQTESNQHTNHESWQSESFSANFNTKRCSDCRFLNFSKETCYQGISR